MNRNSEILAACSLILGLSAGLMLTPVVTSDGVPKIALWLELTNRVCTSIGGLGTFVAVIFVVRQFKLLRWQTELLQKNVISSMNNVLYNRLDSFNRFIVEHHKIYDLVNSQVSGQEPVEQQAKLHHLCDLGFTFYEEIFKQHTRYQLLHDEDRDEWNANMQHFFGKPYIIGYWKLVSARYSQSFQKFVSDMYKTMSTRAAA